MFDKSLLNIVMFWQNYTFYQLLFALRPFVVQCFVALAYTNKHTCILVKSSAAVENFMLAYIYT